MIPNLDEDVSLSRLSMSFPGRSMVDLTCTLPAVETDPEGGYTLLLSDKNLAIVGRQEGGRIEYLDPHFQPTRTAPGTSRPVVNSGTDPFDLCVSRGHFTLKGSPGGVVLINGVPRPGGGIRPPINGTVMLEPTNRTMAQAEEYLIPIGSSVKIRLPNGCEVLLAAS